MGGTWDATNVIDGDVAVVTPIDLDHTDRLGETPGEIAIEKAGIIKQDATVDPGPAAGRRGPGAAEEGRRGGRHRGPGGPGVRGRVPRRSPSAGSCSRCAGSAGSTRRSSCRCTARYQAHNAAVALAAVEAFFGVGAAAARPLDIDTVRKAFARGHLAGAAGGRTALARPSCWTPRTTRRAPGPPPRPSARRSTSAG